VKRQLLAATVLTALAATLSAGSASAATGQNFHLLDAGNLGSGAKVTFYNYDFQHPTQARANNVDWPVTLIFDNNASISAVKNGMRPMFPYDYSPIVSPAYFRANRGGTGRFWTSSKGQKSHHCSAGTEATHFRIYADPNQGGRMYSLGLGYFVVGTSHRDINECAGATQSSAGYPDAASHTVTADARLLNPDWVVTDDVYDTKNAEDFRQEGSHIYENDGLASLINIP
jgi:hypothetical protein